MMYKGLVDNLTFVYAFLAKGRGKLGHEDVRALANGAHTLTRTAPAVLGGEEERAEDRADLAVAQKVDVDIEGMTVFLMSQEIV